VCCCCAGNYCVGGAEGRQRGNGRIVVSEFNGKSGEDCGWDVVKTIEIPSKAAFMDYSGMAYRGSKVSGHVCVCVMRTVTCTRPCSVVKLLARRCSNWPPLFMFAMVARQTPTLTRQGTQMCIHM
jgi:hypothetical protein